MIPDGISLLEYSFIIKGRSMNVLVVGGSGATGKCFVNELLSHECTVTVIVRGTSKTNAFYENTKNLTVITGNILEMDFKRILELVNEIDAIGSCLGHNMTLKGVFGQPRKLVTETLQKLCKAVKDSNKKKPIKFVLMNTSGVKDKDFDEKWSLFERIVMSLVRNLIPPQNDNEQAANFLKSKIGRNDSNIEWVIVRPDALINEEAISDYQVFDSQIRSPIFNPGKTSRINVGSFMSELIINEVKWNAWKGKMPVIYNDSSVKEISTK